MIDPFNFEKIAEKFKRFSENASQEQPDIFKAFFQGFEANKQEPFRGEDLRLDLAIEFDDAILGCEQEIRIPRLEITDKGAFERVVKSLKVKIPVGVSHGRKLRLKRQGDASKHGGNSGDLFLYLLVPSQDNERKRNCINIESEIKITSAQALAGCEMVVKTSTGAKTIFVSPGTKTGDSLILSGYGVANPDAPTKNGNHIIKFVCE